MSSVLCCLVFRSQLYELLFGRAIHFYVLSSDAQIGLINSGILSPRICFISMHFCTICTAENQLYFPTGNIFWVFKLFVKVFRRNLGNQRHFFQSQIKLSWTQHFIWLSLPFISIGATMTSCLLSKCPYLPLLPGVAVH